MRLHACLVALVFIACAPSVPRPMRQPTVPDAGVDLPATITSTTPTTSTTTSADARPDNRSPVEPATDARSDAAGDAPARVDASRTDVPKTDARSNDTGKADGGTGGSGGSDGAVDVPEAGASDGASDGLFAVVPAPGDVIIDELLINPAGTDTNREWIEIANVSAFALDLHQLHVADAASDVAVDAGLLAPGGFLVLGQSIDPTKNGGAPIAFSFGNVISLNNGGDSISVCLGPCVTGVVLDQVVWTADPGAAYDGHAAIVGAIGGATAGLFCPAEEPFGDAGSFGSPGAANPPCSQ